LVVTTRGVVLKKEMWERRSHAFQSHFIPDLGLSRTLTPIIAQMPSHAKRSFSSRNLLRQAVTYSTTT